MKPWEETWSVDETGRMIRNEGGYRIAEAIELDIPPREGANAKLAAAAPEMARLLRELHGQHGDRRTFDWAYWSSEIEAVLIKAGVERHGEEP